MNTPSLGNLTVATLASLVFSIACGGDSGSTPHGGDTSNSGGTSNGGSSNGTPNGNGGAPSTGSGDKDAGNGSGGAAQAGSGGSDANGGSSTGGANGGSSPSGGSGPSGGASASGGAPSSGDGGLDDALSAAAKAAQNDPLCTGVQPFYWEIGDADGTLHGESVGGARYSATTDMEIASASKWVFGAYVVERFKDDLSKIDDDAMTMRSGYVSLVYDSCVGSTTVQACFDAGKNSTHTAADDGLFYYNGGHFQKYAVDLGLGGDDAATLTADMKKLLGSELDFAFRSPQLAGGIHTSATGYAGFLRKILRGDLAIGAHLGENAVCTLPSSCKQAAYSPASPEAWHYSYGHWVEDDPTNGDGAFSSPGAFGFYPWIDATKTHYGIVARYSLSAGAYVESAKCGNVIRRAYEAALHGT
ncbi:MAG TPA: hypothetical protein VHC69_18940 [Polyangiaceae bacterium]|nr:hypothetical protein [Polyangiaceae bacterium]